MMAIRSNKDTPFCTKHHFCSIAEVIVVEAAAAVDSVVARSNVEAEMSRSSTSWTESTDQLCLKPAVSTYVHCASLFFPPGNFLRWSQP